MLDTYVYNRYIGGGGVIRSVVAGDAAACRKVNKDDD